MEIKENLKELHDLLKLIRLQAKKANASLTRGLAVAKEVLLEIRKKKGK